MTDPVPIRPDTDDYEWADTVPGLPVGSWHGSVLRVERAPLVNEDTGEVTPKYLVGWSVDVNGRTIDFEKRIGTRLTKNSSYLQIAVAILGADAVTPAAVIDARTLVGGEAILTCEPDPKYGFVIRYTGIPKRRAR